MFLSLSLFFFKHFVPVFKQLLKSSQVWSHRACMQGWQQGIREAALCWGTPGSNCSTAGVCPRLACFAHISILSPVGIWLRYGMAGGAHSFLCSFV